MTVASLSAISGPKFVMYTSKSARTSPFMAKKAKGSPNSSNLSTPEGLSGRARKLSASRFMESVLGGLGLGPAKHEQFLTVPGEQQPQQCGAVGGSSNEGRPREKSKSLATLFPRSASEGSLPGRTDLADDNTALSNVEGESATGSDLGERTVLPRVEVTDTDAVEGGNESVHDEAKLGTRTQPAPNGSGRSRKSGIAQQGIILEELRQIKKLRQIIDSPPSDF